MYEVRRRIGVWVQRARVRALLPTVLALFLGLAVGSALGPWLQVAFIGSGAGDGGAKVDDGSRTLRSKIPRGALSTFSSLDLGLFAAVELALQTIEPKDGHEPVFCLGLVGMVKGEFATDEAPTVPEWVLNWVRDYYPNYPGIVIALPDCVESWGSLNEIQLKKTYENSQLIIIRYPRSVTPSIIEVAVTHVVPHDIHTYGSSYLLRITRSGVILIDENTFRNYH